MALKKLDPPSKNRKLPTNYAIIDYDLARLMRIVDILALAGYAPRGSIRPSRHTPPLFEARYKLNRGRYAFRQAYGVIKRALKPKHRKIERERLAWSRGKRAHRARRAAAGLPRI